MAGKDVDGGNSGTLTNRRVFGNALGAMASTAASRYWRNASTSASEASSDTQAQDSPRDSIQWLTRRLLP